jgi:excisionase family DNA binding protein
MKDDEDVLTTREAAKLLDVSLRTVQLWVESGVLKAWKTPGGHRKVSKASVQQVIDKRINALNQRKPRISQNNFSILLVEDDEALQNLFKFYFSNWKFKVNLIIANNGFDGLISIGKDSPDLIVTDLMMPGMDGFEMIRHLKESDDHQNTEIVVITGLEEDKINQGGLPSEVKVFKKPISLEIIESVISDSIKRKYQNS